MSPSYEPAELARYREEYPEEWQFPEEVTTGTLAFQRAVLRYRIEELKIVVGQEFAPILGPIVRRLDAQLARLDGFIAHKRDSGIRRFFRS